MDKKILLNKNNFSQKLKGLLEKIEKLKNEK